ncbi:hypothetical protein P5673_009519 [Acropora cervicornis]|uniref:Uncharacterized protein n=1 Tax=Acropora cervicornis TaxID=6130 RepID=A0AAD9QSS9_ACRCE|nr:hypothetical protein P5673_009519 [Acropora cervicornis]
MGDEQSDTVQVVKIGQAFQPAEVTIFYSPHDGFEVHNGYLSEDTRITRNGRTYRRLTIVTSMGNKITVRRHTDTRVSICRTRHGEVNIAVQQDKMACPQLISI